MLLIVHIIRRARSRQLWESLLHLANHQIGLFGAVYFDLKIRDLARLFENLLRLFQREHCAHIFDGLPGLVQSDNPIRDLLNLEMVADALVEILGRHFAEQRLACPDDGLALDDGEMTHRKAVRLDAQDHKIRHVRRGDHPQKRARHLADAADGFDLRLDAVVHRGV